MKINTALCKKMKKKGKIKNLIRVHHIGARGAEGTFQKWAAGAICWIFENLCYILQIMAENGSGLLALFYSILLSRNFDRYLN